MIRATIPSPTAEPALGPAFGRTRGDPEGRFAQETVDGGTPTSFYYDGLVPMSDYTFALFGSGGQQIHRNVFAAGDAPLYLLVSGVRTYAYQDALGSVIALANGSASPAGALAGSYAYDAFGQTPNPDRAGVPLRRPALRSPHRAGLRQRTVLFPRARDASSNPIPSGYAGGNNLYAYAGNDPAESDRSELGIAHDDSRCWGGNRRSSRANSQGIQVTGVIWGAVKRSFQLGDANWPRWC